jgi:invasion protein IalB
MRLAIYNAPPTVAAMMKRRNRTTRAVAGLAMAVGVSLGVNAQEAPAAAWRVECAGDGKALDCRALQQVVRDDKQPLALLTVRVPPDSKIPTMMVQLPLGLNLVEPVQIRIDNGPIDKQAVQTCTAGGCFVGLQLNDKMQAAMRGGTQLKLALQDVNKRPIAIDVPLLGFAVALDKIR